MLKYVVCLCRGRSSSLGVGHRSDDTMPENEFIESTMNIIVLSDVWPYVPHGDEEDK